MSQYENFDYRTASKSDIASLDLTYGKSARYILGSKWAALEAAAVSEWNNSTSPYYHYKGFAMAKGAHAAANGNLFGSGRRTPVWDYSNEWTHYAPYAKQMVGVAKDYVLAGTALSLWQVGTEGGRSIADGDFFSDFNYFEDTLNPIRWFEKGYNDFKHQMFGFHWLKGTDFEIHSVKDYFEAGIYATKAAAVIDSTFTIPDWSLETDITGPITITEEITNLCTPEDAAIYEEAPVILSKWVTIGVGNAPMVMGISARALVSQGGVTEERVLYTGNSTPAYAGNIRIWPNFGYDPEGNVSFNEKVIPDPGSPGEFISQIDGGDGSISWNHPDLGSGSAFFIAANWDPYTGDWTINV